MKYAVAAALLLAVAIDAASQANLEDAGYRELAVISSGETRANFGTGQIEYITEADMVLIAEDEAENLPIKAGRVDFQYADEESTVPTRIRLAGNVRIEHPEGNITAEHVDMNFETSQAKFTGNPAVYNERFPEGFFGDEILLNLEDETVNVKNGRAKVVRLTSPDPAKRLELTEAAVTDWPGFLTALRAQASSTEPSPGLHVASRLDPVVRNAMKSSDIETLLLQQRGIVKLLNGILAEPTFYDAEAWSKFTVSSEITDQLNTPIDQLDKATLVWANRMLLHTAFSEFVAAPPPLTP